MKGNAMKYLEAAFLIGFVGLILSHANQASQAIEALGRFYKNTVKGLQG